MFDSPAKLALGLVTGIVFGFLLQKGRVAKFEVIVGQFLFKDWTVVKMMGTAVVVGAVGVYALVCGRLGVSAYQTAAVCGSLARCGLLRHRHGALGYCPGTSVAGCGEGRRDAMVGVLGMFGGAALFVAIYPSLEPVIKGLGDWGKVTLPEVTHTSPWLWVALLVAGRSSRHLSSSDRGMPRSAADDSAAESRLARSAH